MAAFDRALGCSCREAGSFPAAHLPKGDGVGASLPDSIIVGRIGPMLCIVVSRVLEGTGVLFCLIDASLFAGLGVSAIVGFGSRTLSASASRVLVDCETPWLFEPSAARAPAARISSSVGIAEADFLSRNFDFRAVVVGVSDGGSFESSTVCFRGSGVCLTDLGFFSRATITSCPCIFPIRMTPQINAHDNCLSVMPRDKRMNPFTSPRS